MALLSTNMPPEPILHSPQALSQAFQIQIKAKTALLGSFLPAFASQRLPHPTSDAEEPIKREDLPKNSWSHLSFHQSRAESACPVPWSLMPGLLRTLGG